MSALSCWPILEDFLPEHGVSVQVRADHGASNVDGATITTTPLAWKVHDAGKRGIAWGKPSSATAQPEREGRIAWDHVAPAEGVADDIDFPTPSSAKSRSLSWPGNQERLKQPAGEFQIRVCYPFALQSRSLSNLTDTRIRCSALCRHRRQVPPCDETGRAGAPEDGA
jgi:hypothetical protein